VSLKKDRTKHRLSTSAIGIQLCGHVHGPAFISKPTKLSLTHLLHRTTFRWQQYTALRRVALRSSNPYRSGLQLSAVARARAFGSSPPHDGSAVSETEASMALGTFCPEKVPKARRDATVMCGRALIHRPVSSREVAGRCVPVRTILRQLCGADLCVPGVGCFSMYLDLRSFANGIPHLFPSHDHFLLSISISASCV
jgi:hypothetical protein